MGEFLPIDVLHDIMNKASPWTAYCMALSCKALLLYYEFGKCAHNIPAEVGGCDKISSIFKTPADEDLCGMTLEDELLHAKLNTKSEDPEVLSAWIVKQRQDELDWYAWQNAAGRSSPQGNLSLGGMTICSIKGRDFTFICHNSDGSRSSRQLLLIDDYYKIQKGEIYKSFVCDSSRSMIVFKACFPTSKRYKPCLPSRECFGNYIICSTQRQIAMSNCGLFDGQNSEDVEMSSDCHHRGYEWVGFTVSLDENLESVSVRLQLNDADYYCS